jgi:ABC-type polysaccharide/polyol phosphate transport system ATPase subunit
VAYRVEQISLSNPQGNVLTMKPQQARDPLAADVARPIVRVTGLGKKFRIYPTRYGRLAEWLTFGRALRHEDFCALREVTFDVRRGESLGIIGVNGSGKSTLLKILSGAMYPTEGSFDVNGRVLSLLELGTGLNQELTGRQNVTNSASLLGFPADYATERMSQIEAFAELGDFFDRPVRLYSSGMLVRLSFSMFASFDPEIFIVDEALSVGDVFFQQKCARRIQQMREGGTTMLFVSHDLAAVEALCDRVLLLHGGRVRHDGDKKTGIRLYYAVGGAGARSTVPAVPTVSPDDLDPPTVVAIVPPSIVSAVPSPGTPTFAPISHDALPWQPPDARDGFGDGSAEIDGICFRREGDRHDSVAVQGEWIEIFMRARAIRDVGPCNVGLGIYDRHNRLLFACTWINSDLPPIHLKAGEWMIARFCIKLDLEPGEYLTSLAVSEALRDERSPTGWDYHIGGVRHAELPHAAVIAVTPRADRRRPSFGPANLATQLDRLMLPVTSPND